jgi:translocator protein
MSKKSFLVALIFIAIPLLVGGLSSYLTVAPQQNQYFDFIKPSFAPPSWLFGPVWTILYILMGLASYLIWQLRKINPSAYSALVVYAIQLVFNFAWTGIFFGLRRFDLAFLEIVILWLLIMATLYLFWRLRPLAGILLIPYLLWVSFAMLLNFSIWQLN